MQYAWRFANDSSLLLLSLTRSVLTTVSIQYSENTIAAACMLLSITGFDLLQKEKYMPILLNTARVSEAVILRTTFASPPL